LETIPEETRDFFELDKFTDFLPVDYPPSLSAVNEKAEQLSAALGEVEEVVVLENPDIIREDGVVFWKVQLGYKIIFPYDPEKYEEFYNLVSGGSGTQTKSANKTGDIRSALILHKGDPVKAAAALLKRRT
jgi:hypothetical protein